MSNLAFQHSRPGAADQSGHGSNGAANPFWCAATGSGAALMAAMANHIDLLSQGIHQLPQRAAVTRPVVGQYLCMLRSLAAGWQSHTRPALTAALDALAFVGASMAEPHVRAGLACQATDGARSAGHTVDALQRRLAAPIAALARLDADFGSYLAQMARASAELENDTALVSARVQSDFVHAFLLSQQASALQCKLDDARLRQRADWLVGPQAELIRQEISLHLSAHEGVRHQLELLSVEQAATRAEADYLQSLLPSLSTYLPAVERIGGAIRTTLDGACAIRAGLAILQQALAQGAVEDASGQLQAALHDWQALAASAASLHPCPGTGVG